MDTRAYLGAFVFAIGALAAPGSVLADIVSIIDPPGGGEIEEEVGNISQAAFEALGPVVEDHENGTGPQGADTPFVLDGVMISGEYGFGVSGEGGSGTGGNPWHCGNLSGNRVSFTATDACGSTPAGNWFYADQDPSEPNDNYVRFDLAAAPGELVRAVGLAWIGRDNRSADSELTATVTFADATTLSFPPDPMVPFIIDGTGDGLPNGKDVFIGFEDTGGHGGIVRLEVWSASLDGSFFFHGWDDIGVVTEPLVVPDIPTVGEWGLIIMGLLLLIAVTFVTRRVRFVPGGAWRSARSLKRLRTADTQRFESGVR